MSIAEPPTAPSGTHAATVLFAPLTIRDVTLRNRIGVSPMCQYSAQDGLPNNWHFVHLGSRAVGQAGLVIAEASAVEPRGRITLGDTGLWNDTQAEVWAPIVDFIRSQGAVAGIQLAHAGRKASSHKPWEGGGPLRPEEGAWETVAPSPIPFTPAHPVPHELTEAEITELVHAFAAAAVRALDAGFDLIEIHGAHGYLINEFLSPLTNRRTDQYGGSFENRTRFLYEIIRAVRHVWPERLPVFLRISASDWAEGGWTVEDSIELARMVKSRGIDLIDCSSGGNVPDARIPTTPGYQVPFADRIRNESGMRTAAVGLIAEPEYANAVIEEGRADIVLLARQMLRDPYWPLHAARKLGIEIEVPVQYERAFTRHH